MTSFKAAAPAIVIFAVGLTVLEWVAGRRIGVLPLKMLGVFLVMTAAVRCVRWRALVGRVQPGQRGFTAVLFLLTVRHFVCILFGETRRLLTAHSIAFPRRAGPGWFRALGWAVAGVFRASLIRAERFYAGLYLRGFGS